MCQGWSTAVIRAEPSVELNGGPLTGEHASHFILNKARSRDLLQTSFSKGKQNRLSSHMPVVWQNHMMGASSNQHQTWLKGFQWKVEPLSAAYGPMAMRCYRKFIWSFTGTGLRIIKQYLKRENREETHQTKRKSRIHQRALWKNQGKKVFSLLNRFKFLSVCSIKELPLKSSNHQSCSISK